MLPFKLKVVILKPDFIGRFFVYNFIGNLEGNFLLIQRKDSQWPYKLFLGTFHRHINL